MTKSILLYFTHPHPNLPLEGEGVTSAMLFILPFKGRTEVGMGDSFIYCSIFTA